MIIGGKTFSFRLLILTVMIQAAALCFVISVTAQNNEEQGVNDDTVVAPINDDATTQVADDDTSSAISGQEAESPKPPEIPTKALITIEHGAFDLRLRQSFSNLPDIDVWLEVRDAQDRFVTDLTPLHFQATVGGAPAAAQAVQNLRDTGKISALILLIDRSASMAGRPFQDAVAAAETMIEKMAPNDLMAVASFGDDYKLEADFTNDRPSLKEALTSIKPIDKRTRLFDAIHSVLRKLEVIVEPSFPRLKTILVISDGEDDGSLITLDDIKEQLGKIHIPIFSVGYPKNSKAKFNALSQLSTESWGLYTKQKDPDVITNSFYEFMEKIRQGHLLSLSCNACEVDGTIKNIFIRFNYQGETYTSAVASNMISFQETDPLAVPTSSLPLWKRKFVLPGAIVVTAFVFTLIVLVLRKPKTAQILETAHSKKPPEEPKGKTPEPPPVKKYGQDPLRLIKFTLISGTGSLHPPGPYRVTSEGLILGREGDIRLSDDGEVSSHHSRLRLDDGVVVVEDLNSTNGTIHNGGKVLESERLETGDDLQFGRSLFRVEITGR